MSRPENTPGPRTQLGKNFPIFLSALLLISCVIIRPLIYGVAWGAVFAFLWHPVHRRLLRSPRCARNPNAAATLSLVLLLVCLTIPLAYTMQAIVSEMFSAYEALSAYISHIQEAGLPPLDAFIPESLKTYVVPYLSDRNRIAGILSSIAQSVAGILQGMSKGVLNWTTSFLFQAFIAVTTMFFLIRDGERIVTYTRDFVPLPRAGRERFVKNTAAVMNSVTYGVILTVGLQALLGGIGWWFCGMPRAFLAFAAMFICGMLPMGASIVWAPGAIYLMATGSTGWGVALFLWGAIVLSSIDNIVRPLFISSGSVSISTFALILGLTGGLVVWGVLGVFLGPLTLALFLSLLDLYRSEIVKNEK